MANLTQKMITDVFLQLLKKKNLDKITVREIVDRCDINRNTFYYHYADIFDLFDSMICSYFKEIAALISNADTREKCIDDICAFLTENRSIAKNIYYSSANALLSSRLGTFFDSLNESLLRHFLRDSSSYSDEDIRFVCRFFSSAYTGLIFNWIENDSSSSPKEAINKLRRSIPDAMISMLEKIN